MAISRHDAKVSSSSWTPRSLSVADVEELARFGIMAPPDMRLPRGWHLSLGGTSPTVSTHAMRRAIVTF